MTELPAFHEHGFRVDTQFKEIRRLKDNMGPTESTLQIDYAENWSAKHMDEITSAYYDKAQVTIHPMVLQTSSLGEGPEEKTEKK